MPGFSISISLSLSYFTQELHFANDANYLIPFRNQFLLSHGQSIFAPLPNKGAKHMQKERERNQTVKAN